MTSQETTAVVTTAAAVVDTVLRGPLGAIAAGAFVGWFCFGDHED